MNVDIVMPAFNAGRTITEAIDSVLAQNHPDWTLWVVDDGSTDATPDVVASVRDARVRLLTQQNRGPAAARNRALEQCTSQFTAFLDADDLWEPDHLRRLLDGLRLSPSSGLAWCEMACFDGLTGLYRGHRPPVRGGPATTIPAIFSAVTFLPSAVLCRGEFFRAGGRFPAAFRVMEDIHVWCAIAQRSTIQYVPEVLTRYRVHEGSLSMAAGSLARHSDAIVRSFRALYREHRTYIPRRLYRRRLWWAHHYAAEDVLRGGKHAWGPLLRALRFRPWALATWKNLIKWELARSLRPPLPRPRASHPGH